MGTVARSEWDREAAAPVGLVLREAWVSLAGPRARGLAGLRGQTGLSRSEAAGRGQDFLLRDQRFSTRPSQGQELRREAPV